METIEMLIEELSNEISRGKRVPLSAPEIVAVNKTNLFKIIGKIRDAYPQALREAQEIIKTKDDILAKTEDYATEIMNKSEDKARALMSQEEVVKKAEQYAEQVRLKADDLYEKCDYEARQAAYSMLERIEISMAKELDLINDLKQKLIK